MQTFRLRKKQKGFTLFEIIMTILVGSIIIPPIILMILTALKSPAVMSNAIKGNSLGSDLMEEILSKKWDENSTGSGPINDSSKTPPDELGPESGETRPDFDDVDDYNNYTESPPKDRNGNVLSDFSSYTRSVEVYYVAGSETNDYETKISDVSNFKKIVITVKGPNVENKLIAIVSNR